MKVLGFDNWTGGAHHFERLVPAFAQQGLELVLVHLGSWGNDPDRPARETIGRLSVRDISSYGSGSYADLLAEERPDAVLFFSTDTFAHRAFNRYCQQRGIPTVHLYHGIVGVQAINRGTMYKLNYVAQFRWAASRLGKALRYVWPVYLRSLWETRAPLGHWWRFVQDIGRLSLGRYIQRSAEDARTDRCGVYTDADRQHAIDKYGFRPEHVLAVGNPDLIQFGVPAAAIGSRVERSATKAVDVMYIDTGLVYTGWVFTSEQQFIDHLVATAAALQAQGRHLVFKPHPQHRRSGILPKLAAAGIEVCADADFMARLQQCAAAIVEPSSLSLVPALLGLPLFLASYGPLRDCPYGEVLYTDPRAAELRDLSEFTGMLDRLSAADPTATAEWIRRNAGPLPAEENPHRVAAIFEGLIAAPRRTAAAPA
jgi:hypothetical protein